MIESNSSKKDSIQNYNSDNMKAINVNKRSIGLGNIIYVNLYPIISSQKKYLYFDNFGKNNFLSEFLKNEKNIKNKPNIYNNNIASFRDLSANGTIRLDSSSLIFRDNLKPIKLNIITNENKNIVIDNLTNISINNYDNLQIDGANVDIHINNGKGVYSNVIIEKGIKNSFLKLSLLKKDLSKPVLVGFSNNNLIKVENISTIYIDNFIPIHMIIRQPEVHINGHMQINNLISNLNYIKTGYLPSQNVNYYGNLSMFLYLSDYYNIATDFQVDDKDNFKTKVSYIYLTGLVPQFNMLNKTASISSLVYFLLSIPFLISITFIFFSLYNRKRI